MRSRQLAWWTVLALVGCTETAEVLTKRVRDDQNAAGPGQDAAISAPDAGASPSPTLASSGAGAPSSEPYQPPWERPDAAPTQGETSGPKPALYAPPQLAVGAGHNTTCVIVNRDQLSLLWCFGEAEIEPLDGSEQASETPRGLFVAATGGEHHMCARDTLGDVYCWGDNSRGQLGSSKPDYEPRPRRVAVPRPVSQLSSGASHVCAITDNGQLYCWGNNWEGQLGVGDVFEDDEARNDERREPTLVDEGPWISISAGEGHTCGVKSDGTLSCWGRNAEQQSGNHGEAQLNSPTLVNTEHSWKQAAAGQSHSCGLRTDGSLWCWGSNTAQDAGYPLGLETEWQLTEPTPVGDGRWNSLATTGFHTCAVAENSDLWCWGRNDAGQLGTGDTDLRRTPTMIRSNTRDAVTGRFHSCVVTTEQDDVLCTGSNELGQLALLSDEHRSTFTSLREELERYISVQGAL